MQTTGIQKKKKKKKEFHGIMHSGTSSYPAAATFLCLLYRLSSSLQREFEGREEGDEGQWEGLLDEGKGEARRLQAARGSAVFTLNWCEPHHGKRLIS